MCGFRPFKKLLQRELEIQKSISFRPISVAGTSCYQKRWETVHNDGGCCERRLELGLVSVGLNSSFRVTTADGRASRRRGVPNVGS